MQNPKKPEAHAAHLTQAQQTALPLLAAGAQKKDAAAAAGVCPQTVSGWLKLPLFSATLRATRKELSALAAARLGEATDAAMVTVMDLMKSGNDATRLKAAMFVIEKLLVLNPASFPVEPHDDIGSPPDDTSNDPSITCMIQMLEDSRRMDQAIRKWHQANPPL